MMPLSLCAKQLMQFCGDPIITECCLLNQADADEVRYIGESFPTQEVLSVLAQLWNSGSLFLRCFIMFNFITTKAARQLDRSVLDFSEISLIHLVNFQQRPFSVSLKIWLDFRTNLFSSRIKSKVKLWRKLEPTALSCSEKQWKTTRRKQLLRAINTTEIAWMLPHLVLPEMNAKGRTCVANVASCTNERPWAV